MNKTYNMFKNYFKTTWRNLIKNKAFSLINIAGLALGMACCVLLLLWVHDEMSIDNFHQNGDRLYVVYERQYTDGKADAGYGTAGVLANELKRNIPEIEYASNFAWIADTPDRLTFQAGKKVMKFEGCYADSDYFKMVSYPLLEGNKLNVLNSPLSICISNKMAKAFFGNAAGAIGKTLRYENKKDLIITGVFADLPANVSSKFDFLINWSAFLEDNNWAKEWGNSGPNTLIMLHQNADAANVESKIKNFLANYVNGQTSNYRLELGMQRFGDKYLHSNFENGVISGGRIEYVKLFTIIAFFILLIACINFINLTTARSAKRAKEIGVRKVAGALRSVLVKQFLSESILISTLSMLLSLAIVLVALPYFNRFTGKQIVFPAYNVYFWSGVVTLALVTGITSGFYPAIFLSSFKPVTVLKGSLKFSNSNMFLRKALVVFQFSLSVLLITGTIIVSRQVNFIQKINLGYDRENLVYIPLEGELGSRYELFKQQALSNPSIKSVSIIDEQPTNIGSSTGSVSWQGKDPATSPFFTNTFAGYDFVKTLNLKLAAGRDFSKGYVSDSSGYLINESAQKIMGYKDAIGKPLTFWGKQGTIIGVIKDFHFSSLHDAIKPLIIRYGETKSSGNILIRTGAGKTKQAIAGIEKICRNLNPEFPFTYSFADEEYQKLYESEQVINKLSGCFAFLGIFISCLGLLGLAIFTAEQRTKEIGIRKVLGASGASLVALLSKEFIKLVLLAIVIATPVSWWAMHSWLQSYAYKTPIGIDVFAIAGLFAVLIALLTVSFQAIKAAVANPVKSLRTE